MKMQGTLGFNAKYEGAEPCIKISLGVQEGAMNDILQIQQDIIEHGKLCQTEPLQVIRTSFAWKMEARLPSRGVKAVPPGDCM